MSPQAHATSSLNEGQISCWSRKASIDLYLTQVDTYDATKVSKIHEDHACILFDHPMIRAWEDDVGLLSSTHRTPKKGKTTKNFPEGDASRSID